MINPVFVRNPLLHRVRRHANITTLFRKAAVGSSTGLPSNSPLRPAQLRLGQVIPTTLPTVVAENEQIEERTSAIPLADNDSSQVMPDTETITVSGVASDRTTITRQIVATDADSAPSSRSQRLQRPAVQAFPVAHSSSVHGHGQAVAVIQAKLAAPNQSDLLPNASPTTAVVQPATSNKSVAVQPALMTVDRSAQVHPAVVQPVASDKSVPAQPAVLTADRSAQAHPSIEHGGQPSTSASLGLSTQSALSNPSARSQPTASTARNLPPAPEQATGAVQRQPSEDREWARLQAIYRGNKARESNTQPTEAANNEAAVQRAQDLQNVVSHRANVERSQQSGTPARSREVSQVKQVGLLAEGHSNVIESSRISTDSRAAASAENISTGQERNTNIESSTMQHMPSPISEPRPNQILREQVAPLDIPETRAIHADPEKEFVQRFLESRGEPVLPLEAAWPVQQTIPATPEQDSQATQHPVVGSSVELHLKRPSPAIESQVRSKLDQVRTGQPTESKVELITPRRPRLQSNNPGRSVDASSPAIQRVTEEHKTHSSSDISSNDNVIETEIGDLPADLWKLIGEQPPAQPNVSQATSAMGNPQRMPESKADWGTEQRESIASVSETISQTDELTKPTSSTDELSTHPQQSQRVTGLATAQSSPHGEPDSTSPYLPFNEGLTQSAAIGNVLPVVQRQENEANAEAQTDAIERAIAQAESPTIISSDEREAFAKGSSAKSSGGSSATSTTRIQTSSGEGKQNRSTKRPKATVTSAVYSRGVSRALQRDVADSLVENEEVDESESITTQNQSKIASESATAKAPEVDSDELARRVYSQIKRRLAVERERIR